jgi:hypothetical protein
VHFSRSFITAVSIASPALAQTTTGDPFPPLSATDSVIRVGYREFATLPDIEGVPARMMLLTQEPGTNNLFVNDMRGPLYRVSADGQSVTLYVNIDDPRWEMDVQSQGRERGFQSFAFHPQFNQQGAPGFGRFYTWTDVVDRTPPADFTPGGEGDARDTHDIVLLEWTAKTPAAATYDGEKPRELLRVQQPYANHNGGQIAFNPLARQGQPDFGMLYVGNADGGSGGDPMNLAQNMASIFGKILRIDPAGRNSTNGKYGIPADNPFVSGGPAGALKEIYASGMRNPQRFGWDSANGRLYVADIGQGTVEELSPVPKGGNLGWNVWEGSYRYAGRSDVDTTSARGDGNMTYPIAEYDHSDPLLTGRASVTGVVVYRASTIPQLRNRILFGDMPSGEIFHVSADDTSGGKQEIRRVLLNGEGEARTFLQIIREKNGQQGKQPAARADLRFGTGPNDQVFLLNKADGVIRLLLAASGSSR